MTLGDTLGDARRLLRSRRRHGAPLGVERLDRGPQPGWRHDRALARDRRGRRRPGQRQRDDDRRQRDPLHRRSWCRHLAASHSRPGADATVSGDGVTIVGPGPARDLRGASASTFAVPRRTPSQPDQLDHPRLLERPGSSTPAIGAGKAEVAASYSDYDPAATSTYGPNATVSEANVSNVGDAGFVDAAGGDYHLLPGSPLIDTGDPAARRGSTWTATRSSRTATATASAAATRVRSSCQPAPARGRRRTGWRRPAGWRRRSRHRGPARQRLPAPPRPCSPSPGPARRSRRASLAAPASATRSTNRAGEAHDPARPCRTPRRREVRAPARACAGPSAAAATAPSARFPEALGAARTAPGSAAGSASGRCGRAATGP